MLQIAEQVRNFIADSKFNKAMKLLLTSASCRSFHNELRLHAARLSELKRERRLDIKSPDELRREKNKIGLYMLEIADDLDNSEAPSYNISSGLEQILALAESQSRKDGKEKTSTRYVLAALLEVRPQLLEGILGEMEKEEAIQPLIKEKVSHLPHSFTPSRTLSHCVLTSLTELDKVAKEDNPITPEDILVDVSMFGVGKSVKLMRERGVDEAKIEEYVRRFGLQVKRRSQDN